MPSNNPRAAQRRLLTIFCFLILTSLSAQTSLYWIGGAGEWDDPSHWTKVSGNPNALSSTIPDEDTRAVIDLNSGLQKFDVINIPAGTYAVFDLEVTYKTDFTLQFEENSSTQAQVVMNVFGDLTLNTAISLDYQSPAYNYVRWKFTGPGIHEITTSGEDLKRVEFLDENATYEQLDDLEASQQLRMYGGVWNSNGHDVRAERLFFRDNASSSNPLTKVFNTAGSTIFVDEWDSKLTYGSLTVNGPHTIRAQLFEGSPSQLNGPNFIYDELILTEYSDDPPPGTSTINHYNFFCTDCELNKITIEDTGITELAGPFTVQQELRVVNPGSVIRFNGGNGRFNTMTINGTVKTPLINGCDKRVVFESSFRPTAEWTRPSGTLNLSDAILDNIVATGGATFRLGNGQLMGSSTGWTITNPPTSLDYEWIGTANQMGSWADRTNWRIVGGSSNGCIPSQVDNVFINKNARGDIRIPSDFTAACKDLTWTNKDGFELRLDGAPTVRSELLVTGSLELDASATVSGVGLNNLTFSSTQQNTITTNGVSLPRLRFAGEFGSWELRTSLDCDQISVKGGTLRTEGKPVTTSYWNTSGEVPTTYDLGNSAITVAGDCILKRFPYDLVTVQPGESSIDAHSLIAMVPALYDVTVRGPTASRISLDPITMRNLSIGATTVRLDDSLTVNELIFLDVGTLLVDPPGGAFSSPGGGLTVSEGITSRVGSGTAYVQSLLPGTTAELRKPNGNLCIDGPVEFRDIEASAAGIVNAPEATDAGNVTGIDFSSGAGALNLYWIAGSGDFATRENWSSLSGGCPANRNPELVTRLVFDNNSFFPGANVVTVAGDRSARELRFINTTEMGTLNLLDSLTAQNLRVLGGQVELSGQALNVIQETRLDTDGLLEANATNFYTRTLDTESGMMVVRPGAAVRVREE
ncbi:hypothetical protein [Lewinella sp. 4G2]|uniref:hypothetical protein n=1 Tax=Lewinella sp. 4G2 TaxID=1803372 RepID=UPI0007B46BBA|nr:hypothetical protein [Lewinella sp. 4G2]OAV43652.1 hypothetical protein A3850_003685 [Lewinella sp. 4G2]